MGQEKVLDMSKLEKMDELKGKADGQKRTVPRAAKSICERILTVPQCSIKKKVVAIIEHNWLCSETDKKSTIFSVV